MEQEVKVIHQTILEILAEAHQEVEVDTILVLLTEAMVHQTHQEEMTDVIDTAEMVVHQAEATPVLRGAAHQVAAAEDEDVDTDIIVLHHQ